LIIVGTVVLRIVFHERMGHIFDALQAGIANTAGWFMVLTMNVILLFYGVAEPMFHFVASPLAEPNTPEAARVAMGLTFLHWGLHPWALYTLVGLALAFFCCNRGLPLSIRSVFYPILGDRIYGPIGNLVDILATVATLFGVATSLGLGVQQVNAELDHLLGVGQSPLMQVLLIAGITALATWSVVAGLNAGIRRLSEINLALAALLMFFVLGMVDRLVALRRHVHCPSLVWSDAQAVRSRRAVRADDYHFFVDHGFRKRRNLCRAPRCGGYRAGRAREYIGCAV